jgi:CRP/FNR family cyclic AMP-dependent transcriptional regulator
MSVTSALSEFTSDRSNFVDELADLCTVRSYARNAILINDGDQSDSLFIVRSGRLKSYVEGSDGREFVLGIYGAGDYVGEMSLDGGPRSASVVTLEPTVCSVVARQTVVGFIRTHPDFALELIDRVIRRARMATESARNLALLDVYGRVARLLQSEEVSPSAGFPRLVERLSHQEIANRVGCSREMVSRILKDLTRGGYVTIDKDKITVEKPLPAAW